jgi:phytanoyl-CoA hydroxylase
MPANAAQSFFNEQGYWVVEDLLNAAELATARSEIKRLHQLAAQLHRDAAPAASNFQFEPFAGKKEEAGLPVLRKIENTGAYSSFYADLAAHPALIKSVKNLLGPDLLLFRSTLMLKPALHGSAHAIHQDSAYWPMHPPTLLTVSIALTDATPANGCIRVIPASHTWGLQDWGAITRADNAVTDRTDIDLEAQIEVPLKAGSAVFSHSLMAHGSGPNTSEQPRNTALYAYFPPTVRYAPPAGASPHKTFRVVSGLEGRNEHTMVATSP